MEATTPKVRTREEILAWLDAARQRKEAWEKRVHAEWEARKQRGEEQKRICGDDSAAKKSAVAANIEHIRRRDCDVQ